MSIERQIMNGHACLFCKMNIILVMLAYVPCQTSIAYSKSRLMREWYIFIIFSGKYLHNLDKMPTDLDIFRAIT